MDTNKENGTMVADRILNKYRSLSRNSSILAEYDIMEVPVKSKEK